MLINKNFIVHVYYPFSKPKTKDSIKAYSLFDKKGKLASIQKPFWGKGQTDFAQENTIYSAEVISWLTGKPATSGQFKGKVVTKKPPKGERFRKVTKENQFKHAVRSLELTAADFKIKGDMFTPETMLKPTKRNRTKSALSASKRLISQSVNYSKG